MTAKFFASMADTWRRHRRAWFIGIVVTLAGALLGLWFALLWDLPTAQQVRRFTPENRLIVKAMDGSRLYSAARGPAKQVKYRQIPEYLVQAVVATEDRRFYNHPGIDLIGIGRALWRDAEAGEVREGGSTITQQLARNLFLTQERTLWRKFKEILIAARIEQELSKAEILTLYLNQIYFGSGAYGVADAARLYFSKNIEKLTLTEAALLAGLPQAPSRYSPLIDKTLARKRRDVVLKNMVEVGYLNAQQYASARKKSVVLRPGPRSEKTQAAYFVDYVRSQLASLLGTESVPGGLTIETTLDPQMQAQAQKALGGALADYRSRRVGQGAIITLDPATGEIRAMAGGGDYQKSQFNRTVQALRQPGSTFKTFVYTAAIESGSRPEDILSDRPVRFGAYQVKNADRRYYGEMTLVNALKESRNTVAVQLFTRVGEDKVVDVARRMGVRSRLRTGAAMALGASELTLLELTSAHGTLANGGVHVAPTAVRRIVDSQGKVLYAAVPRTRVALSSAVAATVTRMLEQVIANGTGRKAAIDRPAAGKTGTSENYRDLLFVGYTPQLVTGVWLGNDDNRPTRGSSALAAVLWGRYMGRVMATFPVKAFPALEQSEPLEVSPPMGEEYPAELPEGLEEPSPEPEPTGECYESDQGQLVCPNETDSAASPATAEPPPEVPDIPESPASPQNPEEPAETNPSRPSAELDRPPAPTP
ncbi:transglycosylase domain-containing protein [Gloeobacter violaceus]|uniref:Penicillin-binding protein n=1 Tax=Gloeobacter violaceus (strain ATCC 29082 / PCC 7421) TaxID=251221 RepID=Q7NP95_GLOVI|nr:PBP1A family penicillin-binding protein [Gloeobacter violaceus]BAC88103.1 penicillin-binding protein [Gloeobacter violaceus PCC 7421]